MDRVHMNILSLSIPVSLRAYYWYYILILKFLLYLVQAEYKVSSNLAIHISLDRIQQEPTYEPVWTAYMFYRFFVVAYSPTVTSSRVGAGLITHLACSASNQILSVPSPFLLCDSLSLVLSFSSQIKPHCYVSIHCTLTQYSHTHNTHV